MYTVYQEKILELCWDILADCRCHIWQLAAISRKFWPVCSLLCPWKFIYHISGIRNRSELLPGLPSSHWVAPSPTGPRRPGREPRSLALVVAWRWRSWPRSSCGAAAVIISALIFRLLALLASLASFPASKLASFSTAGMLVTVLLSLDGTPLSIPAHNDTNHITLHCKYYK